MKTLLIPTDFSDNAGHAAEYGYYLAKQMRANVLLCNAVIVPAEMPQAGFTGWPIEENELLIDDSTAELQRLKAHLELTDQTDTFRPEVGYVNEAGRVTDVVNANCATADVGLVVIGRHGNSGWGGFLLANHCSALIDAAKKPLLVVPPEADVRMVKKIAFATDFNKIGKDMKSIYELIALARPLNAEILLTHVYTDKHHSAALQLLIDQLLTELSNKADYPHIYYRALEDTNAEKGLTRLCEHGQVDILAMNHGPYSFIDDILSLSHTKKMAAQLSVPLLVFRA
ncbi:universal stress protein [Mucilaginibacter sp. OK283]|jgi:nucleotide-binding universal stress UspA family protein|uniref:universal stress protein n=1 Tax=Mucilaginibacter sp. OK283 TaxID=1881049 RepID=UPI0008CF3DB1|nr:universal stress protein [Mucilaginibacter sp. OK283]SEP19930.1 Nucleotide-binding universal stress protein, UspA family [Mucilaginibacter sp. OK283]